MKRRAGGQRIEVTTASTIEKYFQTLGFSVQATLALNQEPGAFTDRSETQWFWIAVPTKLEFRTAETNSSVFVPIKDGSEVHEIVRLDGKNIADLFRSPAADQILFFFTNFGLTLKLRRELEALQTSHADLRRMLRRITQEYRDLRWLSLIKTRRTATLIHDCRNILSWARNSAQWMMTGRVTSSQRECLSVISGDLSKLGTLVDRYEHVEELDVLRVQQVDLDRVSRDAIQSVEATALRKSIQIVPLIDKVPPVVGDRGQLQSMLNRVLVSAITSAEADTVVYLRVFRRADEIYLRVETALRTSGCKAAGETGFGVVAKSGDSRTDPAVAITVQLHGGRFTSSRTPEQCNAMIALPVISSGRLQTEVLQ